MILFLAPKAPTRPVTKPAWYRAFLHRTAKRNFFAPRSASLCFSPSLHFPSRPFALSTGPFCSLRSPHRIHETPLVPRCFALYRAPKFFRGAFAAPSSPSSLPCASFVIASSCVPLSFVIPLIPRPHVAMSPRPSPSPVLDTSPPQAHSQSHRGADLFRVCASKLAESSALVRGRPFEPAPGNAGEGSLHFFLPYFPGAAINRIRIIL